MHTLRGESQVMHDNFMNKYEDIALIKNSVAVLSKEFDSPYMKGII